MSGTSIDAVDYAVCSIREGRIELQRLWQAKFPAALRERLHRAARGDASARETAQLHHDLGRFYARAAKRGLSGGSVALAGLHGQTIYHRPEPGNQAATFQIGEPAYLVEELGVPVVSNFRAADLAAGGQGAPLATVFHQRVFGERGRHVCVNNLGGISNVTSLDWRRGSPARVRAFDTGPANVLIDLAMRKLSSGRLRFDRGGAWARRGRPHEPLLRAWLKHGFFAEPPPKSTGRELFGERFLEKALRESRRANLGPWDVIATLTQFTVRSVVLNYRLHLGSSPDRVIVSGGGAENRHLVESLRTELQRWDPKIAVETSAQLGWPSQSVEPAAFALLAYLRVKHRPGNVPSTTGARRDALLGQLSEPA